jgi:putative ABC transport system ATP-binding protein/lipoprotein-releasing system ATP-binding protein
MGGLLMSNDSIETLLVKLNEVGCIYGQGNLQFEALKHATCQIMAGDRIALVGPSGSGKSTLLQLMGGLDAATKGTIEWFFSSEAEAPRPKFISYVFQMPSLLPPLTVVENVELPLLLLRMPAVKARESALLALQKISLESLANKLPEELSGGQAQRVAVARALAHQPRIILADEPTGQLDHATASKMLDVLLASLEGTDTALVIATHDMEVAGRMDTIWHMNKGILEVNQS